MRRYSDIDESSFLELIEKLGANDPCPCNSGRRFKKRCRSSGRFRRRDG